MRSHHISFIPFVALLLLGVLLGACAPSPTPTATISPPTAAPTEALPVTPPPTGTPLPTESPQPDLDAAFEAVQGIEWWWTRFVGADGSVFDVEDPSRYTLVLNADGTLALRADCNRGSGTYAVQEGVLTLDLGALTQAACPPDSLHDRYLDHLRNVRRYTAQDGQLTLTLVDGGQMIWVEASQAASGLPARDVLNRETLANLTYQTEVLPLGVAVLEDGVYSEPAAPGSAAEISISLGEQIAFDQNRQRAAAILIASPGGSGTFYDLALVERDGAPRHVDSILLGDRVVIEALAFEGAEIVVDMVTHGPDDPMCCPTQRVRLRYALQEGVLVEVSRQVLEGEGTGALVVGRIWTWQRFLSGNGDLIEVDDSTRYTLALGPDGTYHVEADCNVSGGTYTLTEGSLVLELGPTTLAECGPDSLSERYLTLLGNVRTYVLEGEQLYLDLWADGGQMVFQGQ